MVKQDDLVIYEELGVEYAQHQRVHPEVLAGLIQGGQLTPTSRVLEIGCGAGNYVNALQALVGCSCRGIDPCEELLTNARARSTEVQFQNARAESLPFFHDSFDLAFSVDVVHQVQDRLAAFQESFRVLKQGGKFCTVTHSEEIIRHRRPLAVYFRETVAVDLARYPSIAHIRHLVEQAGFQQLEEALVDFPYPLTDITAYRDKAFSCLHLISAEHFRRGIERMDEELQLGPIIAFSRYLMLWATKVDPLSEI